MSNVRRDASSRTAEVAFDVSGVHFEYSSAQIQWTYHDASDSIPLRDGAYVRIVYTGSSAAAHIVVLEVAHC